MLLCVRITFSPFEILLCVSVIVNSKNVLSFTRKVTGETVSVAAAVVGGERSVT